MTYDVPVFTLLLVGKVLDYRIFYPPWQTRYLNIDYMSNLGVYIPVIPHTGIIRCKYKNPSYEKQTSSGVWTFLLPFLQWKYSDQCIVWRKERSKNISMKFWANVLTLWETKILLKKNKSFFYYYYFHILIQNLHFKIYFSRCYRFKFPNVLSVSKLFCFHVFYLLKKLRTSQHKKTYIAKFEYIGRLNHGEYFF